MWIENELVQVLVGTEPIIMRKLAKIYIVQFTEYDERLI